MELLAIGNTALASADFSVPAGGSVLVYLKDDAGPNITFGPKVYVQIKDNTEYFTIDTLDTNNAARLIYGGKSDVTYRLYRPEHASSLGAAYA